MNTACIEEHLTPGPSSRADDPRGHEQPVKAGPDFDSVRRLEAVVADVHQFLDSQLDRLEQERLECRHLLERQAAIEQTYDQLKRQQQEWKQHREEEVRRIEQETTALLQAWERLEEEQRRIRLMGQGVPSPVATQSAATPASPGVARPASQDLIDAVHFPTYEPAAVQFQQLRREIRQHARRRR